MAISIFHILSRCFGEGNDNPLQYSCLENPMDGGSWKAAVHGVTEGRAWLNDFTFTFSLSCIREGNGNPLQCSRLKNPKDRGAWWATVYGVAQSQTWLKWLSRHALEFWKQIIHTFTFWRASSSLFWVLFSCPCFLNAKLSPFFNSFCIVLKYSLE